MSNEKISGVYCILNKKNNKIYIGSSKDVFGRKTQHYSELRGGYHENTYLQNSWNKYGEDSFEFIVLEEVKDGDEARYSREQYYIDRYYDEGKNCYNINPIAYKPPTYSIGCAIYDREGNYIKCFDSIRECSRYLNIGESWLSTAIKKDDILVASKYRIRYITNNYKDNIGVYKPKIAKCIYVLDNDDNITMTLYDIPSVCEFVNGKRDRTEETKIANCLNLLYKYNNFKIIYKSDFDCFGGYPNLECKKYKYILRYNFKGELLETIENKYGSNKIPSSCQDNCKINTKLKVLNRDSLRLMEDGTLYLKSDNVEGLINTGITTYLLINTLTNETIEFTKAKKLYSYLNITKSTYEKYYYSQDLYKGIYLIKTNKY